MLKPPGKIVNMPPCAGTISRTVQKHPESICLKLGVVDMHGGGDARAGGLRPVAGS